jgi:hypothetical protein
MPYHWTATRRQWALALMSTHSADQTVMAAAVVVVAAVMVVVVVAVEIPWRSLGLGGTI